MRVLAVSALAVTLLAPAMGWAAVGCPDRTPAAIMAPAAASVACQTTIASQSAGFAKAKLKALGKCLAAQVPGVCPGTKETDKINKAAAKAAAKIAAACGTDSVQAGLASSYAALTDDAVMTSCVLSQHNATSDVLLGEINGTPSIKASGDLGKCVKALNKTGVKHATGAHKIVNKCLASQMKLGTATDLAPICLGSYSGAAFVAPTDAKAAAALATLETKTTAAVTTGCAGNTAAYIPTIFACPGSATVADLQACMVCDGWDAVADYVTQENSETGTFVANGPGALQTAVSAAAPGTKLLIGSGDYAEQVTIATNGLQLVGCGGATGSRPRIVRPAGPGPFGNGISAGSIDGLVFQSLDVVNWDDNGIFVSGANGVTFRDVHADGALNSTYGIFPVQSNNVVVETSSATNVADAGIYVGQSTNILARYNTATHNVAGLEIENSANAVVHNNYTADNSGGLLVFKLPNLPIQVSTGHQVFSNVTIHNNTANFGLPGSTVSLVPAGTGMLIISNENGQFRNNLVQGNNSFGLALVDQQAINILTGTNPFLPTSPVQKAINNKVHNNFVTGNGSAPDFSRTPVGGDVLMALGDATLPHGNCLQSNGSAPVVLLGANDCP